MKSKKKTLEIADIFKLNIDIINSLNSHNKKIATNIIKCRTKALGGHMCRCDNVDCNHEEPSYNSCNDRHCPKCQYRAKVKWVENRLDEVLPVSYFHTVFTLPHVFNEIILTNKKVMYDLLLKASSKALIDVFKTKYNAKPGIISVLHTWGQNLSLHPHVHMIVPQGGLSLKDHQDDWIDCKEGYSLPIRALSPVFRAIFIKGLKKVFNKNKLIFLQVNKYLENPLTFEDLISKSLKKDWVVYSKKPFSEPIHVLKYLGGYTHRIAFSNYRIKSIKDSRVYFSYKDYANNNEIKTMSLSQKEFIRRFLMHTVPKGFLRIRYYGFMSNCIRAKRLAKAREILKAKGRKLSELQMQAAIDFKEQSIKMKDHKCPSCQKGIMVPYEEIEKKELNFDSS